MTYKKFIKIAEEQLIPELDRIGFCYDKKNKFFFSFHHNIVFRIKLTEDRFSSLRFEHNVNVKNNNYELFPESFSNRVDDLISIVKWDYSEIKEHDEQLDKIVNEMLFVIKNYVFNIASSVVNNYDLEPYIIDAYEVQYNNIEVEKGPFSDAEQFMMSYLADGKTYDDWSVQNDEEMYDFTKEKREIEFPFEEFRTKILSTIEENLPKYKLDVSKYNECVLKPNPEIHKVYIKHFLFETTEGKKVVEFLKNNNYLFYKDNGCYESINRACFFNKNGYEVFINIDQFIFLEIEIVHKKEYYNAFLHQHDFDSFSIGWLIGDERVLSKNVDSAIVALKQKLLEII